MNIKQKTTISKNKKKERNKNNSGGRTINITDPNVDPNTRVVLKNGETTTVGQLLQKNKR